MSDEHTLITRLSPSDHVTVSEPISWQVIDWCCLVFSWQAHGLRMLGKVDVFSEFNECNIIYHPVK